MLLFESYTRRVKDKVRAVIKNELHKSKKNIELKLQEMALEETALYVIEKMSKAIPVSTSFEVYDFVLKQDLIKEGLYCEFGVWQGKSVNYMAKYVNAEFHAFDSFEGLPEYWKPGFDKGAFAIQGRFPQFEKNVVVHKGWFNETLPDFTKRYTNPIALIHIDCDLYSSTKTVLYELRDQISVGTIIIFDEYFNFSLWKQHEYKAFQEFVQEFGFQYEYLCYNKVHQQVVVKITGKN